MAPFLEIVFVHMKTPEMPQNAVITVKGVMRGLFLQEWDQILNLLLEKMFFYIYINIIFI